MQTCPECGSKIIGRADKKFCNDGCRNSYNNKQNKDSTNLMRNINNRLRKNYRILIALEFIDGKFKCNKEKLRKKGFDFDYITNIRTYKNGAEYRFVYNIGYKYLDDGWLLVVQNN